MGSDAVDADPVVDVFEPGADDDLAVSPASARIACGGCRAAIVGPDVVDLDPNVATVDTIGSTIGTTTCCTVDGGAAVSSSASKALALSGDRSGSHTALLVG